jgi:hypothetical protein
MKKSFLLIGCCLALASLGVAQAPPLSCERACVKAFAHAVAACRGDQACIAAARAAFDTCIQGCSQ